MNYCAADRAHGDEGSGQERGWDCDRNSHTLKFSRASAGCVTSQNPCGSWPLLQLTLTHVLFPTEKDLRNAPAKQKPEASERGQGQLRGSGER